MQPDTTRQTPSVPTHPWWHRVRHGLGLERNIAVMIFIMCLLGLGKELWARFVPMYLEWLGAGAWGIALYGTLRDLLNAVYKYPGGWLMDRLGRRTALLYFTCLAMLGYGIYMLTPNWIGFLIGTCFAIAWDSVNLPVISTIIGDSLPQTRRATGFGVQSLFKRLPILLAPLLGGSLIASLGVATGMRLGLGFSIALACLSMLIIRRAYADSPSQTPTTLPVRHLWQSFEPPLVRLLIADTLSRWAGTMPKVFLVLYVVNELHVDPLRFGGLISLQMMVSMLLYLPVAKLSDYLPRRLFVLLTFAFYTLFPLVLMQASALTGVIFAFVIAGLREIGEPARKAQIVDLAPAAARGQAVGLYYLIRGLAIFPASLIGGWLWTLGHDWLFYASGILGFLGFLVYAVREPAASVKAEEKK